MSAIPRNGIPEMWNTWRFFVESLIWAYSTEVDLSSAFGFLFLYCQYHWHRELADVWDENHDNIECGGINLKSQNEHSQDMEVGTALYFV